MEVKELVAGELAVIFGGHLHSLLRVVLVGAAVGSVMVKLGCQGDGGVLLRGEPGACECRCSESRLVPLEDERQSSGNHGWQL